MGGVRRLCKVMRQRDASSNFFIRRITQRICLSKVARRPLTVRSSGAPISNAAGCPRRCAPRRPLNANVSAHRSAFEDSHTCSLSPGAAFARDPQRILLLRKQHENWSSPLAHHKCWLLLHASCGTTADTYCADARIHWQAGP